jgi:hypothetical protein
VLAYVSKQEFERDFQINVLKKEPETKAQRKQKLAELNN